MDDLVDINGSMGYVWKQATPTSVYGGLDVAAVGKTLIFTDYSSFTPAGSATLTAIHPVNDANLIAAWQAELAARNLLDNGTLVELVLDQALSLNFSVIEIAQLRPNAMTVKNTWLHDGLAAGVDLKGADLTTVQNTLVERTGYRGIGVNFDAYWWEGGFPHDCEFLLPRKLGNFAIQRAAVQA